MAVSKVVVFVSRAVVPKFERRLNRHDTIKKHRGKSSLQEPEDSEEGYRAWSIVG